jgi:hypothetical protein
MFSRASALSSSAGFSPVARDAHDSGATHDCQAVHVFLSRGNNEPYPGRQGVLADAICAAYDDCGYEDIIYHNPLPAPYCKSVDQGVANGVKQLTEYAERCPDSKIVVSGYSQGAQVVTDVLGGGGGTFFQGCIQQDNGPLDVNSSPGSHSKWRFISSSSLTQFILCLDEQADR